MGKARSFSDAANDTVYQTGINSENYSMGQQNAYNLGSVHFTDQSGIGNFSQAGTDQRKASLSGALFLGNLGFDLQTAELDVVTFTIDLNNDSAGVVLSVISTDRFVTLSSGSTADLVTITGVQRPGQRLRLYNTTTNTITIKHTAAATVNTIRTPDGTDLTFLGNGVIDLTFDITSAQWRVVGNVGGSGGVSLPIITSVDVRGNVNTNQDIDLSLTTAHSTTLTLTGDIDITFSNFPATANQIEWEVQVTQDGTGGHVITWPSEVTNPPSLVTTADSISVVVFRTNDGGTTVRVGNTVTTTGTGASQTPWLQNIDGAGFTLTDAGDISIRNILTDGLEATLTLERNDTTALDGDTIGDIFYDGPTDTGANATWAAFDVESSDVSNAAKQGELTVSVQHDNALTPILNYTGSDATLRVSSGIDVFTTMTP